MANIVRFREFIQSFTRLVEKFGNDEERMFTDGKVLLSELIAHDDWLPERFSKPHPQRYQQYLLYCDGAERFSVVSFVWGPGQETPIHDHTVWGMVGVMRGMELCEEFQFSTATAQLLGGSTHQIKPGEIDLVSPRIGDIHRVSNALGDRTSVSIHIYGANIGTVERSIYRLPGGDRKPFISGYSSAVIPNIWDK